jgi:peroxiredoxin
MTKRLEIGDRAPEFSLKALDGSMVSLSDFDGKPVVIVLLRSLS